MPQGTSTQHPSDGPRRVRLGAAVALAAAVAVLGLGVGFLGGMAVESSSNAPGSVAAGLTGRTTAGVVADLGAAADDPLSAIADADLAALAGEGEAAPVAAVGSVVSISGPDFVVRDLDGEEHRVCTTNATRVVTLRGNGGVRNLSVGDPVFFKGLADGDGIVTAVTVIAGSFPDLRAGER